MSTQKLPIVPVRLRENPRMSATSTAMPVAAETKFCTVSPSIWVTYFMVVSPAYACQLVLVTKLTAVLKARSGRTAPPPTARPGTPPVSAGEVEEKEAGQAEGQQAERVPLPAHLPLGVDARRRGR